MGEFRTAMHTNTEEVNKVITKLSSSLTAERTKLSEVRDAVKQDQEALSTSITSQLELLVKRLHHEDSLQKSLAKKSEKLKLRTAELHKARTDLHTITAENTIIRGVIAEANSFMQRILAQKDGLFTATVRQHLNLRLYPVFKVLHQIVGLSVPVFPKEGGETDEHPKDNKGPGPKDGFEGGGAGASGSAPTGNIPKPSAGRSNPNSDPEPQKAPESSKSAGPSDSQTEEQTRRRQGKRTMGADDVDEDEIDDTDIKVLARNKARSEQLDELQRIIKEADEAQKKKEQEEVTKATLASLFPPWTKKRIVREIAENDHWLQPKVSFEVGNTADCQLEFPMSPVVFFFRSFYPIRKNSVSDTSTNTRLLNFYLKHAKPQADVWSLKKIVSMRIGKIIEAAVPEDFTNVTIMIKRGSEKEESEVTLADLPMLNPVDWIHMYHLVKQMKVKHDLIIDHLAEMIKGYLNEVAKLDVEIASILQVRTSQLAPDHPTELSNLKIGLIRKENWSVAFRKKKGNTNTATTHIFYLADKHYYRTVELNRLLELIENTKANSQEDRTCFSNMIKWYEVFRKALIKIIPYVYKTDVVKPQKSEV